MEGNAPETVLEFFLQACVFLLLDAQSHLAVSQNGQFAAPARLFPPLIQAVVGNAQFLHDPKHVDPRLFS